MPRQTSVIEIPIQIWKPNCAGFLGFVPPNLGRRRRRAAASRVLSSVCRLGPVETDRRFGANASCACAAAAGRPAACPDGLRGLGGLGAQAVGPTLLPGWGPGPRRPRLAPCPQVSRLHLGRFFLCLFFLMALIIMLVPRSEVSLWCCADRDRLTKRDNSRVAGPRASLSRRSSLSGGLPWSPAQDRRLGV